ncbi:bifunctional Arginine-tRNA ligase/Aminoacyl-tRNA synthetase [Babesia duncani]|uniref:arginine--tRNA ligase n=1 Tax=Babesia duncani TaxID=323732 RepID=A0AAD9PPA9_9APIC|nr:bifunctional Arginine-tRNA ligase/Aminoacyl-tRNA synthetase [Babesia duncani]
MPWASQTPEQVAQRLAAEVCKEAPQISACVATSNGYVNLTLCDEYILSELERMYQDERLGIQQMSSQVVLVDYFGPNVGKELHMGHLRSAAIGASIANILAFCGCKVHRRNHLGDFGAHSGSIMRYMIEYDMPALEAVSGATDYDEELEQQRNKLGYSIWTNTDKYASDTIGQTGHYAAKSIVTSTIGKYYALANELLKRDADFSRRAKRETALLQRGSSTACNSWKFISITYQGHYRKLLEIFGLDKIKDMPESLYAKRTFQLIESLVQRGLAQRNEDGSVVIVDNDIVLMTRQGAATYVAVDLATLAHRMKQQTPHCIIYVTDDAQAVHFERLRQLSQSLKIGNACNIEHVGFGPVAMQDGKKMRSRSGETHHLMDVTLRVAEKVYETYKERTVDNGDVYNLAAPIHVHKVTVGSMIYAELSTRHHQRYTFSLERLLNQGGNSLLAILYAYVRALKIARAAKQRMPTSEANNCGPTQTMPTELIVTKDPTEKFTATTSVAFRNPAERRLALRLLSLEIVVLDSFRHRTPHRLCKYLHVLSKEFNRFYESSRVITPSGVHATSLLLTELMIKTVKLVLGLLNIPTVDRL